MWNGFVGQRIASSTKNLRRLGIGLLLAALALGLYEGRTIVNVARGPVEVGEAQLAVHTGAGFELRNYATVHGRNTTSTGITSVEKTTRDGVVQSESTTGEFMATVVGKHILVVETKPGNITEKYTGGIVALPDDVKQRVLSDLKDDPGLQSALFPMMLDATGDYDDGLILASIAIGALVLLSLWPLIQASRRSDNPELHPLCKALSQYGPVYSLVPEIDAEFATASSSLGGVTFTRNWVICCALAKSVVLRRDEIIWVYKKRTKHSVNFIPTGSTYALILRDAKGKLLEISCREKDVDAYITSLAGQTPWVIFGYDGKLENLYKKQRQTFAQTVSDRRKAIQAATA